MYEYMNTLGKLNKLVDSYDRVVLHILFINTTHLLKKIFKFLVIGIFS